MKNTVKRGAVLTLAGIVTIGGLAGCGDKKIDGTQTVATVNGTDIPLGVLSLAVRDTQAQTESMYLSFLGSVSSIWDTESSDEDYDTYGEQVIAQTLESLELDCIMTEQMDAYGVEITEEDEEAIKAAAESFMEANSDETIADLGVTEEDVVKYLEYQTVNARMYYAVRREVEVEVTDEEAEQTSFSYISISISEDSYTEEDIASRREDAQTLLETMQEDPEADMDETATALNEEYSGLSGSFTKSEDVEDDTAYPEDVVAAVRSLSEGEVYDEIIEANSALYIVRKDNDVDEDATESKRESLESDKRTEYYTEVTEGWLEEAEISVVSKVLKTLTLTDSHKYTITTPEVETTEEEVLDATEETELVDELDAEVEETDEDLSAEAEETEDEEEEIPEITEEPEEETEE